MKFFERRTNILIFFFNLKARIDSCLRIFIIQGLRYGIFRTFSIFFMMMLRRFNNKNTEQACQSKTKRLI